MLVSRFEEQVRKNPDRLAVKTQAQQITYRELDQQANRVALRVHELLRRSTRLQEAELVRYQRQMLIAGWGVEAQERLKATTVFVAGAGGSASPLIMQLALCGFGRIIVADDDEVELSNLNRQCLHDEARIGVNKALSAKLTVGRLNPHVEVIARTERITRENVGDLVADAQVIFDNVDHLTTKFILSECAVEKGIPHVISSMMDLNSYAAILYPPATPCFHCLYDRRRAEEAQEIRAITQNEKQQNPNPVVASSLFLATGFAVNEVLKLLLGIGRPALNRYFLFNQRGSEEIAETIGHLSITFPFSEHFRKISRDQGFDWNVGWRGQFVEELAITADPRCPLCGERRRAYGEASAAEEAATLEMEETEIPEPLCVGLLFEHGVEMIVGLIGSLKAGAMYLPLDPNYPDQRLAYMMEDAGVELIVTNQNNLAYAGRLAALTNRPIRILNISAIERESPGLHVKRIPRKTEPLYILYTSGSTGRPKGVYQSHENVWHFTMAYTNDMGITADDRLTLLGAFSADGPVQDIYSGLLNGATLYPLNLKKQTNLADFADWLRRERITVCHCVPTVYRYFTKMLTGTEEFPDLRMIVLGGEGLLESDIAIFGNRFGPHVTLVNIYGQTESSYNSAFFVRQAFPSDKITLGQFTADTELWVVDEENEEADELVVGEIVVVSNHIALGYWNDPERTAQVFGYYPAIGRMYRTGDLGRRLFDGRVEFIGRKDDQVKIRGFRVDLREIESRLLDHPLVKEAVIAAKDDPDGNKYLCAYLVPLTPGSVTESIIRNYLADFLPDYMVPAYVTMLERMPVTTTGKLDRKGLPDPVRGSSALSYLPPRNQREQRLAELWGQVLRIGPEKIGVGDSFFELGGNSLLVMSLVQRINQEFRLDLRIPDIFQYPTIEVQAGMIDTLQPAGSLSAFDAELQPLPDMEFYLASSAQKRVYVLNQIERNQTGYNLSFVLQVDGGLHPERYRAAMEGLIARHESLRTSLHLMKGTLVQRVHDKVAWEIEEWDLEPQAERCAAEAIIGSFIRPFDLSQAPLIRMGWIRWGERAVLLFDIHHAISDGVSNDVIISEFMQLYAGEELPPLRIQYRDFAYWQHAMLESPAGRAQEEYWLRIYDQSLSGREIPILDLPTDYPRPVQQSFAGDLLFFSIGVELTAQLNRFAKAMNCTLNMVLLAAYNLLLARYTGQDDIIVGSPVAGRRHPDLERVVGMFVNTLALRNFPNRGKTCREFLLEVKEHMLEGLENQDYPFEGLVGKLKLTRDPGRNPLFDTMFRMQNYRREAMATQGLVVKPFDYTHPVSPFDLQWTGYEWNGELHCRFHYATRLFKRETVERMAKHFTRLVQQMVTEPEMRLGEIPMLSAAEIHRLTVEMNATDLPYRQELTVHAMIAAQAAKTPAAVAVIVRGERMTYGELDHRAGRLAAFLREKGVKRQEIVGMMLKRSPEMIVAMLGILKAGAAYLPIDPQYPADRVQYMLRDSGARVLISEPALNPQLLFDGVRVDPRDLAGGLREEERAAALSGGSAAALSAEEVGQGSDLCYVIYTSGSTGLPKGAMLTHRSVHNFIIGMQGMIDFRPGMVVGSLTTVSFDIFLLESLLPLTVGGSVALAAEEEQRDPQLFREMVLREDVQMIQLTPSRLQMFLDYPGMEVVWARLGQILIGGEALPLRVLQRLQPLTQARIYNLYGPTETTVWSAVEELTGAQEITIGRPIANTRFYILDEGGRLVPEGVAGELCIAGDGVAAGYLGREELTAKCFLADPFRAGERMYRTGDLARWLPDGRMECRGRTDQQVKIRGYRIELGEIELAIGRYAGMQKNVVIARKGEDGFDFLICYYVAEREIPVSELRTALLQRLPDYMVPGFYHRLERLPLTPNGKIDRKALPLLEANRPNLGTAYLEAETETQKIIATIWADLLSMERVGIDDNFFDLGGDSILLVQVHGRLESIWPGEVTMVDLFTYPTIAKLTNFIEQKKTDPQSSPEAEAYWSLELAEPFQLISLPPEYFSDEMEENELLQIHFTPEMVEALRKIAAGAEFDLPDIATALYIYLFWEISGQEDLILEVGCKGNPDWVFPLRIHFGEIPDLTALFRRVHEKFAAAEALGSMPLPGIVRRKLSPAKVLPFIAMRQSNVKRDHDLTFTLNEKDGGVELTCAYNRSKLRGDKVETLVSDYVKLMEILIKQYQSREE